MNMLSQTIVGRTGIPVLSAARDAAMLRARVISNNIANVNTPGFTRVDVKFEEELRQALDRTRIKGTRTDGGHMKIGRLDLSDVGPKAFRPYDATQPSGVNNVDVDTEMAKLAEAQIMFNYLHKFHQGSFNKLNSAISARAIQS
ncbi:MAG: flagellar basal body rod protein FlgB [Chitinispirillia bacterium]|nr:flagellar basal body rod protein FlgB [Chitinispirillia bacterium]MCL2268224.1 flagellar basal body rod protein FlgB [Chitinispirillia bacterium]